MFKFFFSKFVYSLSLINYQMHVNYKRGRKIRLRNESQRESHNWLLFIDSRYTHSRFLIYRVIFYLRDFVFIHLINIIKRKLYRDIKDRGASLNRRWTSMVKYLIIFFYILIMFVSVSLFYKYFVKKITFMLNVIFFILFLTEEKLIFL